MTNVSTNEYIHVPICSRTIGICFTANAVIPMVPAAIIIHTTFLFVKAISHFLRSDINTPNGKLSHCSILQPSIHKNVYKEKAMNIHHLYL